MKFVSSISSLPISAQSAAFAPTNSADVSAIASAYAQSAASGKQDSLTFAYDADSAISSINGSALAGQGGGGMITSIQSARNPWWQTSISGLNGSSLYPNWAESAETARNALSAGYATEAGSAGAAPTAWASSFITGVSSPSGTIRVMGGTAIESTNSAVMPSTVIEGFSTSFDGATIGPGVKANYVFPTANPSTEIIVSLSYNTGLVLWSSDNGIEGSQEKGDSPETFTAQVPNATAVDIWADSWIGVDSVTASAATQEIGGGVAELAWASALPTYSYDSEDKISAINGSAIAGGGGGGVTGDYVEKSEMNVTIGSGNIAFLTSFSQGQDNTARSASFVQGHSNSAKADTFAQGRFNYGSGGSFVQGVLNTATSDAFAQGSNNAAGAYSLAQGYYNSAKDSAFAQGVYNTASLNSFAQGVYNSAINAAVVFGKYNLRGNGSTSSGDSAAFAIGDGISTGKRHDLMLVTKDGEITMYSSTADTVGTGIMSSIRAISAAATGGGGVDSATVSAIASSYAESAASSKLDTTAFNSGDFYSTSNPSGFLTGVDLSPYQTTADMSGYIPTSMSSDFQQVTGMSSYVPYSSIGYNTASAISGINGSALAGTTYSAGTGIDITDDVISVEAPVDIVAGPGIVIDNPDGNTLRVSTDENYETVLWSGTAATSVTCSEAITNFERLKVYVTPAAVTTNTMIQIVEMIPGKFGSYMMLAGYQENLFHIYGGIIASSGGTTLSTENGFHMWVPYTVSGSVGNESSNSKIVKVVGIHRITNN